MGMSAEETRLHREYETANETVKQTVDAAYDAARAVIELKGMTAANDDRAEQLVAAIYRYVIDSTEQN